MTSPLLWVNDMRPGSNDVTTKQGVVPWAALSLVKFLLCQVP